MPESRLIPAIESRLSAMLEMTRRQNSSKPQEKPAKPTVTISREFGCEAYPVAEQLRQELEKQTKESWSLMDKALLEEVTRNHNLSEQVLHNLGDKNRFLDEFLSTFSSRWKSDRDYYRLLCRHIIALAEQGNVILMGRGAPIITNRMKNCYHFRMYASPAFKEASIAKRMGISTAEASELVERRQKERNAFIRDFLDRDPYDLSFYHLVFNNDRNSTEMTARTICSYLLSNL